MRTSKSGIVTTPLMCLALAGCNTSYTYTLGGLADEVINAIKAEDPQAYAKLAVPEEQEELLKAFEIALSKIREIGVKPSSIEVVKKECRTWGGGLKGECELEIKASDKTFRIKMDDSTMTKDGWRMVGYVSVSE